jgi:hypothetical protein
MAEIGVHIDGTSAAVTSGNSEIAIYGVAFSFIADKFEVCLI